MAFEHIRVGKRGFWNSQDGDVNVCGYYDIHKTRQQKCDMIYGAMEGGLIRI